MSGEPPPAAVPPVRFCPFCGEPLGSFFGARFADGAYWCERCQECFRVGGVNESGEGGRVGMPPSSRPAQPEKELE